MDYAEGPQCTRRFSMYEWLQSSITADVERPPKHLVQSTLFSHTHVSVSQSAESLHLQWYWYKRDQFCHHPSTVCRNQIGILVTVHRVILPEFLSFHFIDYWSLRSSAMSWIVRLVVLLDKGTFESSLHADSPNKTFAISTAVDKISSYMTERGFLHFPTLYANL